MYFPSFNAIFRSCNWSHNSFWQKKYSFKTEKQQNNMLQINMVYYRKFLFVQSKYFF